MTTTTRRAVTGATLLTLVAGVADAQQAPPAPAAAAQDFLLTVFLRHDETKTLAEINEHLKQTGFFRRFPPPGIEVVSWYVMMGIGQVVTLKVPPERLREVNRVLEESAWGGYRTEFYPTYDYRQAALDVRKAMQG
ncbi:MAG: hypothetical protein P4L71_16000 [Acetobacteraceae bacterium]|nr:hypothetical protein [Acetobacteraceae bacterium]